MIIKFNICLLKGWLKEAFIQCNEFYWWFDHQTILAEGIYKWLGE